MYQVMDDFRARLLVWSDIVAHMSFLYERVSLLREPIVIEMGVRTGNSTAALLAAVQQQGGSLWSCDIDPPSVPAEWWKVPEWHFNQGDSVSPHILDWMPNQADVIFIDTDHEYDQTIKELDAYVPRMRKGGVMLMHDTEFAPPNIPLDEPGGDVTRALNDYCSQRGLIWINRPGCYGMGVIYG